MLLDKLSVFCIGPESVLPPRMHLPVAQLYSCGHKALVCHTRAVAGRMRAGWSLKLLLSVIMRLLLQH